MHHVHPHTALRACTVALVASIALLSGCGSGDDTSDALSKASSEAMESLTTIATVGALDGSGPDVLGVITAVAALANGDFIVVDGQANRLTMFARDGSFLAAGGGSGSGPGELKMPVDVAVRGDTVLVLEIGNNRIAKFLVGTSQLTHTSSVTLPIRDRSFCALGGRLFMNGARDGYLVHEIGDDGSVARSFADVPVIEGLDALGFMKTIAEPQLTSGVIDCLPEPGLIVVAPTARPSVSAYHPDGTHAWTTTLADYTQFEYELVPPARLQQKITAGQSAHIAQQVVPWSENTVLVQYELRGPESRSIHDGTIESRFFDLRTGTEIARRTDLPYILASTGQYYYGVVMTPFPQVKVMTRMAAPAP